MKGALLCLRVSEGHCKEPMMVAAHSLTQQALPGDPPGGGSRKSFKIYNLMGEIGS